MELRICDLLVYDPTNSLSAFVTPQGHLRPATAGWWQSGVGGSAHGAVMAALAVRTPSERGGLLGAVAALASIGVALITLAPAKQPVERVTVFGG
jgi:hypothetical protein